MTSTNLAERYRCDTLMDYNKPIDVAFVPFDIWKEGFKAPRPSYRTITAYDIVTDNDTEKLQRYHTPGHLLDEIGCWKGRKDTLVSNIYMSAPNIYFVDDSTPFGQPRRSNCISHRTYQWHKPWERYPSSCTYPAASTGI